MQIETKRLLYALFFPCVFVLILWLVFLLERGMGSDWHRLGIYPRSAEGLWGILTEPFIHSDAKHLFSNSLPLIILGWCLFYFYHEISFWVASLVWLVSGFLTWRFGRESWHIGASGLVYALSFFLFFSGIFRKYVPLTAISLLVAFLYGSTLWNMFPFAELVDPSISWEGHLSGAISGLLSAVIFSKFGPQRPPDEADLDEEEAWEDEFE